MDDSDPWLSQVRRGIIEMAILNILNGGALHGYGLVKALAAIPALVVSEGTIYPLLSRLRSEGWVEAKLEESTQGPARKKYTLSPAGRARCRAMNEAWGRVASAIAHITTPVPPDRRQAPVTHQQETP